MMDSTNSGSLQSSSAGEEEYDSRAESISAFLNPTTFGQIPHAPPNESHAPLPPPVFDLSSLPNFFESPAKVSEFPNQTSLLNMDSIWGRNLRSDQGFAGMGNMIPPGTMAAEIPPNVAPLPAPENDPGAGHVRNPRKRSRASRRAPTTVLTTDTTNFRAMVQEFTGIPAPPFPSSPFPRTRLDLFAASSTVRSSPLDPPPFLLRPFPQKLQFLPHSDSRPTINSPTPNTTPFTIPPDLNLQNPKFAFQSLLPTPPPILPDRHFLGSDQGHLVGFSNMQSSDGSAASKTDTFNAWTTGGIGSVSGEHLRTMSAGTYTAAGDEDKPPDAGAIRTEGIVESWLCPSD